MTVVQFHTQFYIVKDVTLDYFRAYIPNRKDISTSYLPKLNTKLIIGKWK